jgi:ADP-dependent NAD(P)H-hydrate dehydratase / NAD(P)H-hydrate epimerase
MKILSAVQVREWDEYTIQHEPISSVNLMERAAGKCADWIMLQYPEVNSFAIFCGKGNNGGDGLVIARMLIENNYSASVYILEFGHKGTDDFQTNLARLHLYPQAEIHFIQSSGHFHPFAEGQIIVDALLGSGINRPLEGLTAELVKYINSSGCDIVSIDIPSGLFTDDSSKGLITVKARHTLSFQTYKLAFLFAENEEAIGEIHLLDIGLHPDYLTDVNAGYEMVDKTIIHRIYKPRKKFSHKGNFGHALLLAGSYGKIGAAILSAKACMRSGTGLLTCYLPKCGYVIMQSAVPEAMVVTDKNETIITSIPEDVNKFNSIGIGPGIGTSVETIQLLAEIFDSYKKPMVIDADALNCMGAQKSLLSVIPAGSILTPHPKEFERLFGATTNNFEKASLAITKAKELNIIIVLKGHHTLIATPDGSAYLNSTGSAGMATGGSGDVLTGLLTGLLAQGYNSAEAAILGVYLHGLAGDIAVKELSMEAMVAADIIDNLSKAFMELY